MLSTAPTKNVPNLLVTRRALEGDELLPGQIVGPYRVVDEVGAGGFARVYKAEHRRLGSFVALKVLHKFLALSPRMLTRFEQEAIITNRIAHPAVVRVFDISELDDGRPFIALDWLEGTSLRGLLARVGRMTEAEVRSVVRVLGGALACAHHAGVIHRDIKPSNVFAVPNGDWYDFKLLDFGIAKDLCRSNGTATTTGTRIGSPHCMAPEQIRGQPVDCRTDIYALGVLAYQLLSGRLPFTGHSDLDVEVMQLQAPPPPLSRFASVSAQLQGWVSRCMAKQPHERFADSSTALKALERPQPVELCTHDSISLLVHADATEHGQTERLYELVETTTAEIGLGIAANTKTPPFVATRVLPPDEDGARRLRATCTAGVLSLRRSFEALARSQGDFSWRLHLVRHSLPLGSNWLETSELPDGTEKIYEIQNQARSAPGTPRRQRTGAR